MFLNTPSPTPKTQPGMNHLHRAIVGRWKAVELSLQDSHVSRFFAFGSWQVPPPSSAELQHQQDERGESGHSVWREPHQTEDAGPCNDYERCTGVFLGLSWLYIPIYRHCAALIENGTSHFSLTYITTFGSCKYLRTEITIFSLYVVYQSPRLVSCFELEVQRG